GLASDDDSHHVLHVPPAVHEFAGKPIEKRLIRRRLTLRAKVIENLGKAGSKKLFPKTVHGDARGQRVLMGNKPFSEIKPGEFPVGRLAGKESGQRGLDNISALDQKIPARENLD